MNEEKTQSHRQRAHTASYHVHSFYRVQFLAGFLLSVIVVARATQTPHLRRSYYVRHLQLSCTDALITRVPKEPLQTRPVGRVGLQPVHRSSVVEDGMFEAVILALPCKARKRHRSMRTPHRLRVPCRVIEEVNKPSRQPRRSLKNRSLRHDKVHDRKASRSPVEVALRTKRVLQEMAKGCAAPSR